MRRHESRGIVRREIDRRIEAAVRDSAWVERASINYCTGRNSVFVLAEPVSRCVKMEATRATAARKMKRYSSLRACIYVRGSHAVSVRRT